MSGTVGVLTLTGRLGRAAAPSLVAAFTTLLSKTNPNVLIDLSGVDYVSSAGIDAIDQCVTLARTRRVALVLTGLTEPVRFTLALGGVLEHVAVEQTRDFAIQRLSGSA